MEPKDIKWTGTKVSEIEVCRQTEATGEQFVIKIPVFLEDTREVLTDRLNFIYSIMQDRMEDGNEAIRISAINRGKTIISNLEVQAKDYESKGQKVPKKVTGALEQARVNVAQLV